MRSERSRSPMACCPRASALLAVVVEIAFNDVQRSSRYPGGLALRLARVIRYRDDKTAAQADTIDAVRAIAITDGVLPAA